jgi:TolA-binding protein
VLFLAVLSGGGVSAVTNAVDLIEAGDRRLFADGLLNRGFHDLALPEYRALADRKPPPPELDVILYRLGECQRHMKRSVDAEVSYRRLASEMPGSRLRSKAILMRGLIILESGNPGIAAELLESLLATNAAAEIVSAAMFHAGEAREQAGSAAAAIAHYQTLRQLQPKHELAAYAGLRLANLRSQEKTPAASAVAMDLYQKLAAEPFNDRVGAEALFQAASLAFNGGVFETSARLYRQLVDRYPKDLRAAESARPAAWSHFRIGRFADALQFAGAAVDEPGQPPEVRTEWLYIKANCERQLDRRADAVKSYDALLAADPRSSYAPAARYERLLALFKDGAYAQVLKDADGFANPPPGLVPDLLWLQAESAEAIKDTARAIQFYRLLVQQAPQSSLAADASYRLAYQLQQQKAWAEASRTYLGLVNHWPTNALVPQAFFASGLCLAQAGQSDGALRDWHQLLTRFPRHETVPEALFQKAMEETKLGSDRDAAVTLDQILRDHPGYPRLAEARFWRAQHAYAAKDLGEAERLLRACLTGHPPDAIEREAGFLLGLVLQALGRDDDAAASFQPLLNAPLGEKFTVDRLNWLAEFQYARKAWPESEAAARSMLLRAPSPEWRQAAFTLLARALQAQQKRDEAIAAHLQALAVEARTRYGAESALRLGELLLETGRVQEAEAQLKDAATRASTPELQHLRAYAYAALGQAAEQRGDREGAVRFHMSVAILFDDPEKVPAALDRAAVLLAELGRDAESRATVAELLERYPASPQALRWRKPDAAQPPPEPRTEGN